ncbi:phage portal protein [Tepidibacter thalassicus]|uniref:Phage portal protein, HK97 family n=1 Tax=Tepidibacter thalassicus DSM 15285 TaxID=1123350 RepID=A0A1M5PW09_9FIRM|nr:phage portal protein [Tepidibacter thalassicus]SHH06014.1 phage portal protein, HK97 family [Tepidibacter thalassicus DSM 15285]
MIFSRKKQVFKNETIDGLQSLSQWLEEMGLSTDELNISGKNSLNEITVYTCIKILAETVSKLPLKVYKDSNGTRKAKEHYLYSMLKLRPNPYMSASDFWKCIETQRNIYGNAYVWIDRVKVGRKAGTILGLYPLDSAKVKIYVDDVGLLSSKNKIWYVFTDNLGHQYRIESTDLLHFKGLTTNGIAGINPIETLRNSIENAKSSSMFLNNSYKNGMQIKGIIQYVGDLNSKAEQTFREKFEQMSNGLKNANKVSLLPIGFQYQPISLKMTDAQFLENTNLTIRQLTAAYGIKLHQVNDLQKASYASTSEANREFYTDTLMAILKMYEDELTYKLFTTKEIQQGYYMKFNADVILRGDIKTRYEAYRIGIQAGFITPNEVRALEELEPKEGGDQLLVNGTMTPIEKAGAAYEKGGDK